MPGSERIRGAARVAAKTAVLALAVLMAPAMLAQFEDRASFFVGQDVQPYSLVVGDFNGDGVLDIAEVNDLPSGSVDVLLGNGDGTFRRGATYAVAVQPFYASTASLRNNGILDLVVGDSLSDNVWVMLGNGDGTFQAPSGYATTGRPVHVSTGHFTGSGSLDIIALTGNGTECNCVEVLPGNGDGTFGAAVDTPVPYDVDGYSMGVGRFTRGGNLDLAVGGEFFSTSKMDILLGNGDGTFTPSGYYLLEGIPSSVAVGDFTGDKQKADLAVTIGGAVAVLLGDGAGAFRAPTYYGAENTGWVIAQDLNGDGKVDLAASEAGVPPGELPGVTTYMGNGDGTFQEGVFYPVGSREGGDYVAAGDFNGDGKIDLLVVDSVDAYITTLLNTGVVSFSPTRPLNFKAQAVGTTSPPQAVTLTNTGTAELKIQGIKASPGFAVTSTCGARVAPGAACTITATFSPTKQGVVQGMIAISDNASSKLQVIELLGNGSRETGRETRN